MQYRNITPLKPQGYPPGPWEPAPTESWGLPGVQGCPVGQLSHENEALGPRNKFIRVPTFNFLEGTMKKS